MVYPPGPVMLRSIDPRLWIDAVESCPQHYAKLCRILEKCVFSWQDRDRLVEAGAALLPCDASMSDPQMVCAGLRLATVLSCGSTKRVAELEKAKVGEFANEAMYLYPDDCHIAGAALSYLNNLANCDDELHGLAQLGVEPQCLVAMTQWTARNDIQAHADFILARIRNYNGNEEDFGDFDFADVPVLPPLRSTGLAPPQPSGLRPPQGWSAFHGWYPQCRDACAESHVEYPYAFPDRAWTDVRGYGWHPSRSWNNAWFGC